MRPGDLLVVDGSRPGTPDIIDLVADVPRGRPTYMVSAREGDTLLFTGSHAEPEVPFGHVCVGLTRWCFVHRGVSCYIVGGDLDRVRRSLRLVSRTEAA